ncbi:MAG TPA: YfhO family protein [Saprospiraceae bacterium]|nr:YfhO family protein [Saprospiraceae bacterium]
MTTVKNTSLLELLTTLTPHLVAVVIFLALSCIYFFPQFSGKQIPQSDIMQFQGMAQEAVKYHEETGHQTLWTNSMFSGMPTYQITAWSDANKIGWIEKALNLCIPRPVGYFIFAQIGFYLMLILLGVNRWVAISAAIAFAFTTNNIMLFEAGHTSKLRTLFSAPFVIAGMILAFRNKYFAGGVLFCIGLALNIFTNHPQITYYLALCLGILALIELVRAIRAKTLPAFAKASGILVAGALLAVAAAAHMLISTLEYSHETMRGKPTLTSTGVEPTSSSQVDGLEWDYAMQWSNGVEDVLATLIPRGAGGSSAEPTPDDSEWNAMLKQRGVRSQDAPLYWGQLPFTSGPSYFGAIMLFLFVLGACIVRGHLKWWLVGIVVMTILLSMGKHFAILNRAIFEYLPLYHKFRAPSSILTMTAMFVPILGAFAVSELFKSDVQSKIIRNGLLWSYIGVGGITLLFALMGPGLFDFTNAGDARYAQAGIMDALIADRKSLLRADAWRSFLFVTLAMGTLWAVHKAWIKKSWIAILLLIVLILIDLWGIDKRYIAPEDFVAERQINSVFTPDAIDQEILQDKDPHYRVHDLTTDPFNNSKRAYFHHMIGGYHAAKLQRYQDIIERYLSKGHEGVLNMLNARYVIIPDAEEQPMVRQNSRALGNAWFVEGIRIVESAEEEIAALENLDPAADVIVHREFEPIVQGFDPVKNGTIRLTEYAPDKLKYASNSESDQLAVFSEVWYGPNKGWHATIDGQPAELLRANYILRALRVPAGQHEIELVFRPRKYYMLKTVAMVVSILIILSLVTVIYLAVRKTLSTSPHPSHTTQVLQHPMKKSPKASAARKRKK